MENDQKIEDIVAMIDQFMSQDGGHMNIKVNQNGTVETESTVSKTVTQMNSLDCASGDLACSVPTLFEGLDADVEEDQS